MPLANNATLPAAGCLDSFQPESLLPLAFTVTGITTFIICYWMVQHYRLQETKFPIVSQLGEKRPAYWVFAMGSTMSSVLLAATVGLQARNMSRCGTEGVQPISIASTVIGLIACPALVLTGWVSVAHNHTAHLVFAGIAISCLITHCFMSAINSQFAGVGIGFVVSRIAFSGMASMACGWGMYSVVRASQVATQKRSILEKIESDASPSKSADAQIGARADNVQRIQEAFNARIRFHAAMGAIFQWCGFACIMVALSLTAGSNLL